ncbi:MAG: GNAT family N-acetyltransferase [Chitinophagaceae bacterium]
MEIRTIEHGSPEYDRMIALRMDLLCRPLGLSFTAEQLEKEKQDWLIAAFEDEAMTGCCVLTHFDDTTLQLRQMAVRQDIQHSGTGRRILSFAEQTARENGYTTLMMHARDVATGFYEKCGYHIAGEPFTEVTILHYCMEKKLV